MDLQEKQAFRRMAYSKITIALMVVVLAFMAKGTYSVYLKERDAAQQRDMIKAQLATLDARETIISGDVGALQTNVGLERALREKFGVAAVGESVAVIVDSTTTQATSTVPHQSALQKFWGAISDIF